MSSTPENNIDDDVFWALNNPEDIANIRNQGFEAEDDNEPDPANDPPPGAEPSQGLKPGQVWGWDGINCCHIITPMKKEPSYADGWLPYLTIIFGIIMQ